MNVTTPKGGKFYGEELQELTSNGKGGEKIDIAESLHL